ncbi:MAG TPA: DUF5683 domain-containing protein [Chitinophagaceae bacterium]|nr:DUF5683 domain-containing protein [Chitinophagaceae bacterium]
MKIQLFLWASLALLPAFSFAQQKEVRDSASMVVKTGIDTAQESKRDKQLNVYNPRKAAIRSAIFPGLGQIYNKKYWKLPIVYAGLGISGSIFVYNLKWYKRTRFAFKVLYAKDTASFPRVYRDLQLYIAGNQLSRLQYARDQYRRDIDYSALFFMVMWGLNVVDAAVDAHLKGFDVSPDLSFRIKPGHSEMAGTNGLSLVLTVGKTRQASLLRSDF